MMKKLSALTLSFISLLPLSNLNALEPKSFFVPSAFYVGLSESYGKVKGKLKNYPTTKTPKMRKSALAPSLFIGYNMPIPSTFLFCGFEGGYRYTSFNKEVTSIYPHINVPYTFRLQALQSFYGAFRLGIHFAAGILYGKFGLTTTTFKTSFESGDIKKPTSKQLRGQEIGIGWEKPFNKNFAIGFEYSHVQYTKITDIFPQVRLTNCNMRVTPHMHLASIRLLYKFT